MKKYNNVPLESQLPQYERWAKCLQPDQVGNLFFLSWTGLLYRIEQFVENCAHKVTVAELKDTNTDYEEFVASLPVYGGVILILHNALLHPEGRTLARIIENWRVKLEGGVLFVHELAPHEVEQDGLWPSWIYAAQLQYRLPEEGVMREFASRAAKMMGLSIGQREIDEILHMSGGWFWFVKGLLRLKMEAPTSTIEKLSQDVSMKRIVATVWKDMPLHYKEMLLYGSNDSAIFEEMGRFGILDQTGHLRGKLLCDYVSNQKYDDLAVNATSIKLRGVDLTDRFQKGELAVLAALWDADAATVTREEVTKMFWPEKDQYDASDWAIDQKMRRLRQKIVKLGLPMHVVTKKGEGYGLA